MIVSKVLHIIQVYWNIGGWTWTCYHSARL